MRGSRMTYGKREAEYYLGKERDSGLDVYMRMGVG
jgi:hypothetical protein